MDTKANKTDVLSLEEIQATTDLTGKIASASSVKKLSNTTVSGYTAVIGVDETHIFNKRYVVFVFCGYGSSNNQYGVYYITEQVIQNILGDDELDITVNENRQLVFHNLFSWPVSYTIIGIVERVS